MSVSVFQGVKLNRPEFFFLLFLLFCFVFAKARWKGKAKAACRYESSGARTETATPPWMAPAAPTLSARRDHERRVRGRQHPAVFGRTLTSLPGPGLGVHLSHEAGAPRC